jgi:hypothetical protein
MPKKPAVSATSDSPSPRPRAPLNLTVPIWP